MSITKTIHGSLLGEPVEHFILGDVHGSHVKLSSYGATLCGWVTSARSGEYSDCILGYDTFDELTKDSSYLGCTVGRVANRIGRAQYVDGVKKIALVANERDNMLHGGKNGFHTKNWRSAHTESSVTFTYESADGEEGFPGSLLVTVTYTLEYGENVSRLAINYHAQASQSTPVALTNHAYFNLSNDDSVLSHQLSIGADFYTPIGEGMIPTGEILSTQNTAFDLSKPKLISEILKKLPEGLDHNFVLHKKEAVSATLSCESTGRTLRVVTTEPGLQAYTGNFLGSAVVTRRGPEKRHGGICLETQAFPDYVNQNHFTGFFAQPGKEYKSETIYEITVS